MRKKIIIPVLLLSAFIWYLKYPIYTSWIDDTFFDTVYSWININSEKNWMITFKDFEDSIIENKNEFKYLSEKYGCENWKYIERVDLNNIPSKCWNFKKYIEDEDFLNMLMKEKISLKTYDSRASKKVFIDYLNEKKIIENLNNKEVLVYTTDIKNYSDINFPKAKSSYIITNLLNWSKKRAMDMLYNSIKNELFILNNSHLDAVKFFTFETRLKMYLSIVEKCLKEKKLSIYQKKRFKLLLSQNKLEENLMERSLKTKYFELIKDFDIEFKDNYQKNLNSNNLVNKAKFEVEKFLFVDFVETKELYKKYFKETLEQKKLSYNPPVLPLDIKNYIWKKIIWNWVVDYRGRFKQYEKLKERVEVLKNNL